ncbi:gluconate 2-dehydrogenase (acceptor) [Nitratireductor indicus C115]|uniref:Gluconate 2-dehydrogenase (Acceptor) n=1 Tax=Nitratireductor indicus C115 TaxID=1231190 RepID=K2NTK1_9HYPH|nr:GMC family oxidoreductase [Nitratireductor indicus]EKF41109.1 gluconate 2-dehydrogenase (acceptor) [Nitratireductor indicus C115]SFQ74473.1 gluconate 2-dehydrogenase alpha chain [Nitratireductor indicus]
MATNAPKKDVVIVGLGWTGSILAMELCEEGLEVLALERGDDRDTVPDFKYPEVADELKYGVRYGFMQKPRNSTLTVRRTLEETALPYRMLGSFLPGDGVGGAGIHWNGHNWRPMVEELRLRSYVEESFGADIIPEDMTIQDWGVDYDELEPYFDRFEKVAGIAGQAGNINGKIVEGGNPFEAPRSGDFPMPPLPQTVDAMMFADAARKMGYHPFPRPAANASQAYTNPYGMQLGPCNFCGFCERFGCLNYSKSSPQTCVLAALKRKSNFSYKVNSEVLKVELAPDGKTATGVTYVTAEGEEVFQPADLVILAAYQLHNVHLMLLSGIGQPYDPATGEGVTGKNYAYQMNGGTSLFFKDIEFNPFVGAGSNGMVIDDFAINQIDFGKEGFIGGSYISSGTTNGQPIRSMRLPPGTPSWGTAWKQATKEWYGHSMSIGSHGSNMAYRDTYLDLDPTYKDRHGRPLMRMTFNWKPNDIRMTQFMKTKIEPIAESMSPDIMQSSYKSEGAMYDVRPYQTTHNVGGAIMGTDPKTSALNRYLQSWDVHNVFVMGATAFPQNLQYNPTGMVGGLAYWSANAIRKDYLPNPRPLV